MDQAEAFLKHQVENGKTPCLEYVIFDKDTIIYEFTDGLADLSKQIEAAKSTTFHLYSLTKTFTALAVLQLAEKKELDIDHLVKEYWPEFPYTSLVSVRQLLAHTAGIPNPIPLNWIHLASEHSSFDRDLFFGRILAKYNKTKAGPNEKFAYSNLGYVLLGQLIEKITGVSYERYVAEQIIKKLGLQPGELSFTLSSDSQHATGYHNKFSFLYFLLGFLLNKAKYMDRAKGKWRAFKKVYVNGPSYGGLIGNSGSLVKYLRELLKPHSILLPDEYKKLLFTENLTNDHQATGMCLSWFCGRLNGHRYFAHPGGGGGYYSEIRLYPDLGIGSVVLFNRSGISDEHFLDKVDKFFIR